MNLKPAIIEVIDIDKAKLGSQFQSRYEVQFNPTEYARNKGIQIAEIAIPGLDSPLLQFVRGQGEKLTMELFFDTTENGMGQDAVSVTTKTRFLYELARVQSDLHTPPRVRVSWSQDLNFVGVVETVAQQLTLFNPEGVPLRATVSVSFREHKPLDQQLAELNLKSPDHFRAYKVRRGDTLPGIAAVQYGDARVWRAIARHPANKQMLDNPRRLQPGIVLALPKLDDFAEARRGQA